MFKSPIKRFTSFHTVAAIPSAESGRVSGH